MKCGKYNVKKLINKGCLQNIGSDSKTSSLLAESGKSAKILQNTIYCSHRISRLCGLLEKDVLV